MERWPERVFWVSCGILAGFGIMALALPHQLSYAEGYMLEQAVRLSEGGPLYRSEVDPPWVLDNFPPLWTAVLALGVKAFGPSFQWGRALSLISTAALTVLLLAFHRRLGNLRWASLGAAALWLLAPFVLWRSTLVRMDLPALLFAALGVWWMLRWREDRPRRAVLGAAVLFSAAVLSRQTMLVAPAAVAGSLFLLGRRREAVLLGLATAAIVGAAVGLLQIATDGAFLMHVVTFNTGRYSFEKLVTMSTRLLAGHAILLVVGAVGAAAAWRRGRIIDRCLVAWAAAEAAASVTVGKPGAAVNHYLPLLFVASLHAASGAEAMGDWWRDRRDRRAARPGRSQSVRLPQQAVALLLVVQLALLPVPAALMSWHVVGNQDEEARLVQLLRDEPGPILSENAGAAIQSGHDVLLEPRLVLEQYAIGRWDDQHLVQAIASRQYAVIVTQDFPEALGRDGFRFTPDAWTALNEGYEPTRKVGRWQVWEPAGAPAS